LTFWIDNKGADFQFSAVYEGKGYDVWFANPDTRVVELPGAGPAHQDAALWAGSPAGLTALSQLRNATSL
jgi:hypothetical protein